MEIKKINYDRYREKMQKLLTSPTLQSFGLKKMKLGKTIYQYDLDCLQIGYGEKEIFLIGGTHGSEIISVDYLLYLIENLPNIEEFDPNIFTLKIVPLQNPEGFDISTNTLREIKEENFIQDSYEYYCRYRMDNIIAKALQEFTYFYKKNYHLSGEKLLMAFQQFIQTNRSWSRLKEDRVFPKMAMIDFYVQRMENVTNFQELGFQLLEITRLVKSSLHDDRDNFFRLFLEQFQVFLLRLNQNSGNYLEQKFYQEMFEKISFAGLWNSSLEYDLEEMFRYYHHPHGSQVGYDATGVGINLNANQPCNPGITYMKNQNIPYGIGAKDNILRYVPGPIGVPTLDPNDFSTSIENLVIEALIEDSYQASRYVATLLYHGTGGLIYYHPYQDLMNQEDYLYFLDYNQKMASIYQDGTGYQILEESDCTGYGDYLRRTYPGVLLIELSKMGGNPIGPYGDVDNIHLVFENNLESFRLLLKHFQKEKRFTEKKKLRAKKI